MCRIRQLARWKLLLLTYNLRTQTVGVWNFFQNLPKYTQKLDLLVQWGYGTQNVVSPNELLTIKKLIKLQKGVKVEMLYKRYYGTVLAVENYTSGDNFENSYSSDDNFTLAYLQKSSSLDKLTQVCITI